MAVLGIKYYALSLTVSFGLTVTAFCRPIQADDEVSLEYQVKAAYLVNFLKFIEWPNSDAPNSICILGQDPFGVVLDTIAKAAQLNKPVVIRRASNARELQILNQPCHILYAAKYEKTLPESFAGVPVVTVADEPFSAMIVLSLRDDKVRFQIYLPDIESKGIRVSSKLMKLSLSAAP